MCHCTVSRLMVASLMVEIFEELESIVERQASLLKQRTWAFVSGEATPDAAYRLEEDLEGICREMNRLLTEFAYNKMEPDAPDSLPKHIWFEGGFYRRLNHKTRNQHVATRFGKVTLWRFPYRDDHTGDGCVFPVEAQLGLVEGATPALADRAARYMAEAGATQRLVLERLKHDHGVCWGTETLRNFTQIQADRMDSFRHAMQVARVLELLEAAANSSGKRKPVLAVGRDGITLGNANHGSWEVATAATISVFDRNGKRRGTVYLGYPPELGQGTMSEQLTRLIKEILQHWNRSLPRLCYVTDAGESETRYYRTVLRRMLHPRTGQRLEWRWVVDYYHAAQRITAMAEVLFGRGTKEGQSWARRMRKLLLKVNGPSRVLHSAGAIKGVLTLNDAEKADFYRAYNYIRRRIRFMNYYEFRRLNLPIGSGVTEAACKTLFTARLKLSGMRWKKPGAAAVLKLRVILLSGIWGAVRKALLESYESYQVELPRTYPAHGESRMAVAP
jgi:hypothetical protein